MAQENTNNTSPVEDAQLTEKPNYQRTKYSTTVHVRDRETGEMKTVEISRTVYVNTNILCRRDGSGAAIKGESALRRA